MTYKTGYDFWRQWASAYGIDGALNILASYLSCPLTAHTRDWDAEDEFCRQLCGAAGVPEQVRPRG